jgi:hypothetical protein
LSAVEEGQSPSVSPPEAREDAKDAAVRRAKSLQDPLLYFESKRKILELVETFADHGYLSLEDVASALHRSEELSAAREVPILREQVASLEAELLWERTLRQQVEEDSEESASQIETERELVQESLARIASLEAKLKIARRTTVKLIAASRESLLAMKGVRGLFPSETYATGALRPLITSLEELTQVVQELHALAVVKGETAPAAPSGP